MHALITRPSGALAALCCVLAACGGGAPEGGEPTPVPDNAEPPAIASVALVDSVHWVDRGPLEDEGVLWHVAVRYGSRVDTLSGVLTAEQPVVVGDSVVAGFAYERDLIVSGFRYTVGGGLELLALPPNFDRFFSTPALSPSGEYVAYIAGRGPGRVRAVVRTWPEYRPVFRGPTVEIAGTDINQNVTRWTGPETVEIYIALVENWLLVRGVVGRGVVATDTVASVPG